VYCNACCRVLQYVAEPSYEEVVYSSRLCCVVQCVVQCMLQFAAVLLQQGVVSTLSNCPGLRCSVLQSVAVCCGVVAAGCCIYVPVVLVCGAVCCSVTVCCSVLQFVAVCCGVVTAACCIDMVYSVCPGLCCSVLQCVAVCCSVLQCVANSPYVLQGVAVVLQGVAVCCSVLQCVAVCCSVSRTPLTDVLSVC